ncbi:hypothetical protein ABK040_004302 [Willaertia magna]
MKRKQKGVVKQKTKETKKTKRVKTLFFLLPSEIIILILDYSSYENDKIHPFALVSKITRDSWLCHYLSLPYKFMKELKTFGDYQLGYKISFFDIMKNLVEKANIPHKKEEKRLKQLKDDEKNRKEIIKRIKKSKEIKLANNELKEVEAIVNNHFKNIKIIKQANIDSFNNDVFYYWCAFSFFINNVRFTTQFSIDVGGHGPGEDTFMPEEDSEVWDEIIEQCECNLSKKKLYRVIKFLMDYKTVHTFDYELVEEFDSF